HRRGGNRAGGISSELRSSLSHRRKTYDRWRLQCIIANYCRLTIRGGERRRAAQSPRYAYGFQCDTLFTAVFNGPIAGPNSLSTMVARLCLVRATGTMPRIEIVPYDSTWPQQYAEERQRLDSALAGIAVRIEHNGSTSVPGLAAKPVIDIQISVAAL